MAAEEAAETFAAQIIAVSLLLEKAEGFPYAEKNRVEKLVDTTALYCDSANLSPHCRLVLLHVITSHIIVRKCRNRRKLKSSGLSGAQVQEDRESVCAYIPFRPTTAPDPPCVTAIHESAPA